MKDVYKNEIEKINLLICYMLADYKFHQKHNNIEYETAQIIMNNINITCSFDVEMTPNHNHLIVNIQPDNSDIFQLDYDISW